MSRTWNSPPSLADLVVAGCLLFALLISLKIVHDRIDALEDRPLCPHDPDVEVCECRWKYAERPRGIDECSSGAYNDTGECLETMPAPTQEPKR